MSVKRGLTSSQIEQLIQITKLDPLIKKFTNDAKRFRDLETFQTWQKGKTIYVLIDKGGQLLGVIWFGKKRHPLAPGCSYTFAIRTYPPARGKGYALKFMKKAFEDFKPNGVWLMTRDNNLPAIRLYEKFGFRKVTTLKGRLIMAF